MLQVAVQFRNMILDFELRTEWFMFESLLKEADVLRLRFRARVLRKSVVYSRAWLCDAMLIGQQACR